MKREMVTAHLEQIADDTALLLYLLGSFVGAGLVGHLDAGAFSHTAWWVEYGLLTAGLLAWGGGVAGIYSHVPTSDCHE